MAFKVTESHWDIIVNFMELHPDIARGRINGPNAKAMTKKLWADLTIQLNAVGIGERPVQKWQKTWSDFKYYLKKKASGIKKDQNGTGGGPPQASVLTNLESKILDILGKTFFEGLGTPEVGCSFMTYESSSDIQTTSKCQNRSLVTNLNDKENTYNETYKSTPSKRSSDHDYAKGSHPKRAKHEATMESMYKNTLNELKDIKNALNNLSGSASGIEVALIKLADAISTNGTPFSLL